MKRLLSMLCFSSMLLAHSAIAVEADRVVAIVNDEAITMSDLKARTATIQKQAAAQGNKLPVQPELGKQVLERLIVERAQLQLARDSGWTLDGDDLDQTMTRLAASNKMTLADFRKAVEKEGTSWASFRKEIRDEVLMNRVRESEMARRITVTETEVTNYLNTTAATGDANVQVAVQHILVRVPEGSTATRTAELRNKAVKVLALIRGGEDFSKAAASVSDSADAANGGVIAARPVSQLPDLYADLAKKLKVNEVSDVLTSPAGFHIVKLLSRQGGVNYLPPIKQTHSRHILVKVNEVVTDAEAKRKIDDIKTQLNGGADFAVLAKQYSDDLSGAQGGDLGWMSEGETVPDFEKAMDALKLNEVSGVVRSPFGYHIIQVLERRVDEGSPERKRAAARQILRERKSDDAYEAWLRELRDNAYVEYKLDSN